MARYRPRIPFRSTTWALVGALGVLAWALDPVSALKAQWGLGADVALAPLDGPVVVELFTSQSCSSCPPADDVLNAVAKRPGIIALGCHVTYWDHLNWKDTLSLPACTARQRAYAQTFGTGSIYTPQMVVNGRAEFVGSYGDRAKRAIEAGDGQLAAIELALDENRLTARLPGIQTDRPLTLWLAVVGQDVSQSMGAGENRGRTVHYTHPVRALTRLGAWDGAARERTFPLPAALPAALPDGLPDGLPATLPNGFADGAPRLAVLAHENAPDGVLGRMAAAGIWPQPEN